MRLLAAACAALALAGMSAGVEAKSATASKRAIKASAPVRQAAKRAVSELKEESAKQDVSAHFEGKKVMPRALEAATSKDSADPTVTDLWVGWSSWATTQTQAPGTPYWSVWNYFRWTLWSATPHGLTVYVNAISGDPDVFCSIQSQIPFPTQTNYNYSSITIWSESVTIYDSQACPSYPCSIICGVTPWLNKNGTFTIIAERNGAPIEISDAAPFNAVVETLQTVQFNFTEWVPTSLSSVLMIDIAAISGIPAVYVGLNDVSDASKWPDSKNNDGYRVGSGQIDIFPGSAAFNQAGCTIGTLCPIAISVYGRRQSNFTIVVATGHYPIPLMDGLAVSSYVPQGQYRYFDFATTYSNTDVRFIITPESGDPDLVVSAALQTPTLQCGSNQCWVAAGVGPEMITIKASDPNYVDAPALYNIGVYGWAGNATFSIVAVEMKQNYAINLEDGQPQYQQSEPHAFSYFVYDVPSDATSLSNIDFLTTPLNGDVDLYISVSGAYPQVQCVTLNPTAPQGCSEYAVIAGTYAFSSVGSNVADFVTVPTSAQTPGGQIVVGVLATTPDETRFPQIAPPSTYSVVAVSDNGILELQDGLAVVGSVARSAFKYYSYEITNWSQDVMIVGSAEVGSIDLFVSETAQNPGPGFNTWNSTGRGGVNRNDVIYISSSDLTSHCPFLIFGISCTLYIGVKGSDWIGNTQNPATYSLVASLSGNPSFPYYMSSGRAVNTVLSPSSYQYFYAWLNIDNTQSVYLIAQDWSESGTTGLWAALGASGGGSDNFPQPSNNMKADFYSSDLGGFNRIVIAPPTFSADGPIVVPGNNAEQTAHRRLAVERLASLKDGNAIYKVDASEARRLASAQSRRLSAATELEMNTYGRNLEWAKRYSPKKLRALSAEIESVNQANGLVGAAPYCTSCPLYVTLGSRSPTQPSEVSLYYGSGATFTPLNDDVPVPSIIDANGTAYFSFQVPDASNDITISLQPFFGSVTAYVIVQSPRRPYQTAASTFWQYKIQPDVGANSIVISKSDPSFCHSPDGSSTSAPCTYTIAVTSIDPYSSFAYFTILATRDASGGGSVIELFDGEPLDGTVVEGQGIFYQVNPTPYGANAAVAPVLINAAASVGDVTIYVTNGYTPGLSPNSALPGPTNTGCQWTTKATDPNNILISSTDPCFNSFAETLTIGIYGSSGIANFQNQFTVTAAFNQPDLVQKLEFGQPSTNQFVSDATTRVFVFDLADASRDVVISATPTYGDVTVLVAKHSDFQNPPTCKQAAPGAQAICSGWTWLATGVSGASAMTIPAAVPCSPFSGAGLMAPLVNQTSCGTDFAFGRFWVAVWAWKDAEVNVAVNIAGQPVLLSDGEPQMLMTSAVTICSQRDPTSGLCVANGQQRYPGQAAFARIVMPAGLSPYDGDLMMERVCNEDQQGNCGQSLSAYINVCSSSNCTMADAFPSIYDYDASFNLATDADAAINLPMLASSKAVPGDNVVYHVAVYPTCGGVQPSPPGVNCQPALVRLTWAGDSQPQRIPMDCNTAGRVCTIPQQDVGNAPSGVRRYIGYAPFTNPATSGITLTARACMGDVVLSLCNGQAGSKCSPINVPNPTNNDGQASTVSSSNGIATVTFTPAASAQYYFGITKDPNSVSANPLYNLVLGSTVGPTFTLPNSAPTATRDTTVGNTLSVSFSLPTLNTGGNVGNAAGVVYTAYLFPVTAVPRGYNLGAVCGVQAYYGTFSNPATVIVSTANSNSFTMTGLVPTQSYVLAVAAVCPAGACMPSFLNSQDGVYTAVVVPPFGPAPSPSSGPQPSINPNPNPSTTPSKPSGGNGGAIAGGILGTLAAVAVIGGLFYGYKRWKGTGTRYSRMTVQNWGGDNAVVNAYAAGRVTTAETGDSTAAYAPL